MTVIPSTTEAGKKRPADEIEAEKAVEEEEGEDLRQYGDASYWEERYKAKKQRLNEEKKSEKDEKKAAAAEDDDDNSTDEWHFSFEAMKELLPEKKDITVVDVGCGVSSFLNSMREAGYTGRLIGLDYSPSAIDMCKEMFKEVEYHNKEAAEMCPEIVKPAEVDMFLDKATIDGLLADESGAEHVQKLSKVEGQALKVGGQLIWSTMFGPFEESGVKVLKETILPGLLAGDDKASYKVYCHVLDDGTEDIELPELEGDEESAEKAEPEEHAEEPNAAEGTDAAAEEEKVEGDEIDMAELGDMDEMIMQALAETETLAVWIIEKVEKAADAPKDTTELIGKIIEDIEVDVHDGGDDDEEVEEKIED
ncbi:conserved hypothetical protein [Perkinsus marinus ATCC 50983]|uniref:Methyltransferase domain-containing protein n=1 Tax=Perkinsus marinus (strain ATCC 50983 / TXsc) TaxID=423536 RepID=C5KWL7_PERM5|nr:conserved hypothetical protein [Perkinsus marinus ATCC 50983]EER11092.1 conserved hypothetical protein [Perkinsus marinus ATCC 50983]|eukprot:XP_002779297.1 conserved hypothetical protein [Perkinsus marinus ATCC 50983]